MINIMFYYLFVFSNLNTQVIISVYVVNKCLFCVRGFKYMFVRLEESCTTHTRTVYHIYILFPMTVDNVSNKYNKRLG